MYARHFGLNSEPFSIAPDPRFLFMSAAHREALAHLLFGVQGGGGFVLLSGEIGTGKTTVCRAFLEQLPEGCEVAFVLNPRLNATELLQTVCEEFSIERSGEGLKATVDALNAHLLARHAAGGRSLLLIDEAQNLSDDVLEQLRLLTNLETYERKLLQIILIGQPELRERLAGPGLTQLAQRIIARYHLGALTREDSERYLAHRLAVAGHNGDLPFDRQALRALHRLSGGVPRRLNLLADRALLGAYTRGVTRVGREIVERAAREVFEQRRRRAIWPWVGAGVAALGVGIAVAMAMGLPARLGPPRESVASRPVPANAAAVPSVVPQAASAASAPPPVAASQPATAVPPMRDDAAAWRALASQWDAPSAETFDCQAAAASALRCFSTTNITLAQVRQLDRPGIVHLRQPGGAAAAPALLVGIDAQGMQLWLDGRATAMASTEFGARWQGDFATLWRVRGAADARATPVWFAQQLSALHAALDDALPASEQVKAFQRAQGLVADGVPGALTLMQLNRALGVAEPHLKP